MMKDLYLIFLFIFFGLFSLDAADVNWLSVNTENGDSRYSILDQINRDNVKDLKIAWSYSTGDLKRGLKKTIECQPLVVDGVAYISTARLDVVALNAATGKEIWAFRSHEYSPRKYSLASGGVNRGVAFWSDGKPDGAKRILHGTSDGQLFCIDAKTGKPVLGFGEKGVLDLRKGMEGDFSKFGYGPTSAPAIYQDIVILGFSNGEGPPPQAAGDVRAFDVHTGKEVWRFRAVPRPGDFGSETWALDSWKNRGGANAWGGINVDHKNGYVLFGTGSAGFDFYGGDRKGQNLFANCTVVVNAKTGKRLWHYQTLHHDLWDHDHPTYPVLVNVERDGQKIEAAVQVTKQGYIFLFDRHTGKSLFEIKEVPAQKSTVPGEESWPTQPVPVKPPPVIPVKMDKNNITNISKESRESVIEKLKTMRNDGPFTPPSIEGSVTIPGFHGGATWSGASFDPVTGLLYVNVNNIPWITKLKKNKKGYPYSMSGGYQRFQDHEGFPASKPPWGKLVAVDLNKGEIKWESTLGDHPKLVGRGLPPSGTENFGGCIVTAGGLVFIGATKDEVFHGFDKTTGELIWKHKIPAGGYATPCTYSVNGKQYLLIACGGAGKNRTKAGDEFVAFALPNKTEEEK